MPLETGGPDREKSPKRDHRPETEPVSPVGCRTPRNQADDGLESTNQPKVLISRARPFWGEADVPASVSALGERRARGRGWLLAAGRRPPEPSPLVCRSFANRRFL